MCRTRKRSIIKTGNNKKEQVNIVITRYCKNYIFTKLDNQMRLYFINHNTITFNLK